MKCKDCESIIPRDPRDMDRCNPCYWKHKRLVAERKGQWRREYDKAIEKMRQARKPANGGTK